MSEKYVFNKHKLINRMVSQERAKLMAQIMHKMTELNNVVSFALCEGAALHGVYLHKRWSQDLDFQVLVRDLSIFCEALCDLGFSNQSQGLVGAGLSAVLPLVFTFSSPGVVFPSVTVRLDVWPRNDWLVEPQQRRFKTLSGDQVDVVCLSLSELIAFKVSYLDRWHGPVPLFDVWSGLVANPEIKIETRRILYDPHWQGGGYSDHPRIPIEAILSDIKKSEELWQETLLLCTSTFPSFEEVYQDLQKQLLYFA